MSDLPDYELRRLRAVATDDRDLQTLIARRIEGEPLQYLEGTAAFGPLDLLVDGRVLVPRPETELLWERAVAMAVDRPPQLIVDLCTGSGALALALSISFPEAQVIGTDISGDALDVARENANRLGSSVEFREGDLFDALPSESAGSIGLIVSNPPYVATADWQGLPLDVRREPYVALVAGNEGTEILLRIIRHAPAWLTSNGLLACEIGETQATAVETAMTEVFSWSQIESDLTGRPRFAFARGRRFSP